MTTKTIKTKGRPRIWIVIIVAGVLAITILGLEYFRFLGFKKTLIELVHEKSNGTYRLEIEDAEIDYFDLSITLINGRIQRTRENTVAGGLEEILIPSCYINFGSLVSLLNKQQVEIQEFTVTEPIIYVSATKISTSDSENNSPVNIAHEITQTFPFVEEVLDQFNIDSFQIKKAAFDITPKWKNKAIKVRFVDLLIANWNMLDLSDQASLQLVLGDQNIRIDRSEIDFETIQYKYSNRALSFKNLSINQYDTVGRRVVEISNAHMRIHRLDYHALFQDESYIIDQIVIDSAQIRAHIYQNEQLPLNTNEATDQGPKYPVSHLLKENLGQLRVKTGRFTNAEVELSVYKAEDTVALYFPQVTVSFKDFEVTPESPKLLFDNLQIEVDRASFSIDQEITLNFERLFYQDGLDLEVNDVHFTYAPADFESIVAERIVLYNFSLLDYLMDHDLRADSILLQHGKMLIHEPPSEITPKPTGNAPKKPMAIHLGKMIFDDIDLLYDYENYKLHIHRIDGMTENYTRDGKVTYALKYFRSEKVVFENSDRQIAAEISKFYFEPKKLRLGHLTGNIQNLDFRFTDLEASPVNFNLKNPFYYNWNSLDIGGITLTGEIPSLPKSNAPSTPSPPLNIQDLNIGAFIVNLTGEDQRVEAAIKDISLNKFALDDGDIVVPYFTALVDSMRFHAGMNSLHLGNAQLNNTGLSEISNLTIKTAGLSAAVRDITIAPWLYIDKTVAIERMALKKIEIEQHASGMPSTADSIVLADFTWQPGTNPFLHSLRVYSPEVHWKLSGVDSSKQPSPKEVKSDASTPFEWLQTIEIFPGSITLNENKIAFSKIAVTKKPEYLAVGLGGLSYQTEKNALYLDTLFTSHSEIRLEGFRLLPQREFVNKMTYEDDVIDGVIHVISLKEVQWDSLYMHNTLTTSAMHIDGFNFTIKRDKRLPDPPYIKKPFLLSALIPIPPGLIPTINIRDGNLTYYETGEKTGKTGMISVNDITGVLRLQNEPWEPEDVLTAAAKLYDSTLFWVNYDRLDSNRFSLQVQVHDLPARHLNQMIDSLEAVRIKSGTIEEFDLSIIGTDEKAQGASLITYDNLHIEIFKKNSPEQKSLGSDVITFLADGILLNHSKTDAIGPVNQERFTQKGPINFWVKSLINGAISAIRKGKDQKSKKVRKRRGES